MNEAGLQLPFQAAVQPDWSRETKKSLIEWAPYKSLLSAIRKYQANRDRGGIIPAIRWRWAAARWRLWSVIGGISIPVRCRIGGGLQMPHTNGIVINVAAKIGCNCDIYQQVTIGEMKGGCPEIGNGVFIGPGAKILGAVKIGDGARIGANALVISDVPAGALVLATPSEIHLPPLTTTTSAG
ncbi:MAG: serine acetyltransferase [Sphingomicrobium sp.]